MKNVFQASFQDHICFINILTKILTKLYIVVLPSLSSGPSPIAQMLKFVSLSPSKMTHPYFDSLEIYFVHQLRHVGNTCKK